MPPEIKISKKKKMKKLTENLIHQRLKSCTTDLDKVQQINVTGRELQDVSLLRKMTRIEILSLSVNEISSLADFVNCKNLKELYLRNNKISDLNQISYLKNLPKLELLMLSQNPCSKDPLYRMTVIKNLTNLTELDGVPITSEEKRQAQKMGKEISADEDLFLSTENCIPDGPQIHRTPTQSAQKLKSSAENLTEPVVAIAHCETIAENDVEEKTTKTESKHSLKQQHFNEKTENKGQKRLPKNDLQPKHIFYPEVVPCKFCGNENTKSVKTIHKNYNILSAALNLVKELDYYGLQIVNAEVSSRLNAFEIDYIYQAKI